ncbi:hypothetical protein [Ralstonia sp. 1138]|uniref:hypothetical protein n=1 Tax=Ralstonia sp. 1138 TaxID=3156423 RepID=UPI0033970B82
MWPLDDALLGRFLLWIKRLAPALQPHLTASSSWEAHAVAMHANELNLAFSPFSIQNSEILEEVLTDSERARTEAQIGNATDQSVIFDWISGTANLFLLPSSDGTLQL